MVYGESLETINTTGVETQENRIITCFADLSEEVIDISLEIGSLEEVLSLPETLTARVQYNIYKEDAGESLENKAEENLDLEVIWTGDRDFSSETEGEFTYTAKLTDENYILAQGAEMPRINVRLWM